MKTLKITGIFQALVGTGMIGFWTLAFSSGGIPELETEAYRIFAHLLAELFTAMLLLISSFFILFKKQFRSSLFFLSMGALIYTLIASPGYFAHLHQWDVASLFLVLLVLSIALLFIQSFQE